MLLALIPGAAVTRSAVISTPVTSPSATASPITHIVIIYQENHSFDVTLGAVCLQHPGCDAVKTGKLLDGTSIPLREGRDVVPNIGHSNNAQKLGIDGGKMDGWERIGGCSKASGYACYQQYQTSQIPNLAALATKYVISDHTFEIGTSPSWGAHITLVAGRLDGFTGDNPFHVAGHAAGPGWGCDSEDDAVWRSPTGQTLHVPSCIPKPDGTGPYRASPVQWVPTIMDRMTAAGKTWRIYSADKSVGGPPYGWGICPTFADCIYSPQVQNTHPSLQVLSDIKAGSLANLTYVMPLGARSQHNLNSMALGDNWIGSVVSAIMNSKFWSSTAIFITYDDCGCFYDHVKPPAGLGVRVPMVIVSPYAKPAYTDPTVASFASILAFIEHNYGLASLGGLDGTAYDYRNAFNYSQAPLGTVHMVRTQVSGKERRWLAAHPPSEDDPT